MYLISFWWDYLWHYSSLREPWMPTCTVTYWSRAWSPPSGDWAAGQYSNMKTTTALLKKLRVKVMDWPSISPDLNPIHIEHLWGILKQKVEERKVSNIHQLSDAIMEEWKRTPVATCESLVNSMPKTANVHCYKSCTLLYIVAKCHFFSVVTWKDIIKYLQKCEVTSILFLPHRCNLNMYIYIDKNVHKHWYNVNISNFDTV